MAILVPLVNGGGAPGSRGVRAASQDRGKDRALMRPPLDTEMSLTLRETAECPSRHSAGLTSRQGSWGARRGQEAILPDRRGTGPAGSRGTQSAGHQHQHLRACGFALG